MRRIQGELFSNKGVLHQELTDVCLARFAGLFIGEGNLHLARSNGSYAWRVTIAMTRAEDIMSDLKRFFGGTVSEYWDADPKHMPCLYWKVSNKTAYVFLKAISPFLQYKIKREEASIFVKSYEEYARLSQGAGHRLSQGAIRVAEKAKKTLESCRTGRHRA